MTPNQALRITTLRGSTTHEAQAAADDLEAFYRAQAGRGAAGRQTAQRREAETRNRIIAAVGVHALHTDLGAWVPTAARLIEMGLGRNGFDTVPDDRTLRKTETWLQKLRTTEPQWSDFVRSVLHSGGST